MTKVQISTIAAILLMLSACGETTGEQAVIGAGAGAATAVVLNGNVAAGALVGAGGNVLFCSQNPNKC